MREIVFECKKCGTCCRDLLEDFDGIRKGLLLTANETNLFPSEMISPKMAIGVKKPEKIIEYQLNVNVCPHLNERNECRIYYKRPLMCKAFPYESGTFSVKCKVFSHVKVGVPCNAAFSLTEIEASEKLNRYIMNRFRKYVKKGSQLWEFDLATKKWTVKASQKNYDLIVSSIYRGA